MNCDNFTKYIDDYLDETCAESLRLACIQHLAECADCTARLQRERELLQLLAKLPVPEPTLDFLDRALDQSMNESIQAGIDRAGIEGGNWKAAVGSAIAAGLVILALLGVLEAPNNDALVAEIPELTLSLNVPDTIRLSFNSNAELPGARLTLKIPQGIDVIGADGKRSIAWNTTIKHGANILELPVIVHDALVDGRIFTATVKHESREKTFSIRISVI